MKKRRGQGARRGGVDCQTRHEIADAVALCAHRRGGRRAVRVRERGVSRLPRRRLFWLRRHRVGAQPRCESCGEAGARAVRAALASAACDCWAAAPGGHGAGVRRCLRIFLILRVQVDLDRPWDEVRRSLVSACGLKDEASTAHCFDDFNHVDCCASTRGPHTRPCDPPTHLYARLLHEQTRRASDIAPFTRVSSVVRSDVAHNTNEESKVAGMHPLNKLGAHIVKASLPARGPGGSWCTCHLSSPHDVRAAPVFARETPLSRVASARSARRCATVSLARKPRSNSSGATGHVLPRLSMCAT